MSQGKDPNDQPSTSAQESSSDQQEQKSVASVANLLDRLRLARAQKKEAKDKYAFWETQPVMQFSEDAASSSVSGQHKHRVARLHCSTFWVPAHEQYEQPT